VVGFREAGPAGELCGQGLHLVQRGGAGHGVVGGQPGGVDPGGEVDMGGQGGEPLVEEGQEGGGVNGLELEVGDVRLRGRADAKMRQASRQGTRASRGTGGGAGCPMVRWFPTILEGPGDAKECGLESLS
jgi:hypothetical protein